MNFFQSIYFSKELQKSQAYNPTDFEKNTSEHNDQKIL